MWGVKVTGISVTTMPFYSLRTYILRPIGRYRYVTGNYDDSNQSRPDPEVPSPKKEVINYSYN